MASVKLPLKLLLHIILTIKIVKIDNALFCFFNIVKAYVIWNLLCTDDIVCKVNEKLTIKYQLSNISISNICTRIQIKIKHLMNYLQILWDFKLVNRLIKLLNQVYLKVIEILLR